MTTESQTPAAPTPEETAILGALRRMGARLDQIEARKSDADLGHAFRTGRGIIGPIVAIVIGVLTIVFWIESRGAAIAATAIDSGKTRAQVAEQIHAQTDGMPSRIDIVRLEAKLDGLTRELRIDDRLERIENLMKTGTTRRNQTP